MKIALDSRILVRAFLNDGVAGRLLLSILHENHVPILSTEILAETSKVLRYPRIQSRHQMTAGDVYDVLAIGGDARTARPIVFSADSRPQ